MITIFLSIFLPLFIFLSAAHAQNDISSQSRDTIRLEEFACKATSPETLKNCINEVRTINMPLVKIDAPIICPSSNDCTFDLTNLSTDTTFFSTKPENKIIRKNDFSYTVFQLENTSGIRFSELTFEDDGIASCSAGTTCPDLISVKKSENIIIERSIFENSKGNTLSILDSRNITIDQSNFLNTAKTAVLVRSQTLTQSINITENNFDGSSGNALDFQSASLGGLPSSISSNTFSNNHAKGFYENCAYPCIGSQVKISSPTSNLNFTDNKISGGSNTIFDSLGLYPSGLEIASQNINNLKVYCNEISGNLGSGVVQSAPVSNSSSISVDENKIWSNGLNLNIVSAAVSSSNCFDAECKMTCQSK